MAISSRVAANPLKTPVETPQVTNPGLPHINQYSPGGNESTYVNGAYNCAPTAVAMLARLHGKFGHLDNATLISKLAKDLVTPQGTTSENVVRMLERVNIPVAGAFIGIYDDARVQGHLKNGHKLIAQVGVYDKASKTHSAHYVVVRRQTPQGNYVVSDPMWNKPYTVTPKQLRDAVAAAPPNGGLLIPVARHKGGATPAVPTPSAPGPAASPAPAPKPGSVTENRAFGSKTDAFHEVDPTFHRRTTTTESPLMRAKEERNAWAAKVAYAHEGDMMESPTQRVTPEHLTAKQFAEKLLSRKARKDPEVPALLKQLQKSPFPRDQQVLKFIERADLKDGGIGSKTSTSGFGAN